MTGNSFTGPVAGGEVEREIATDMAKRVAMLLPVFLIFGAVGWGINGVWSVAFAVAIVGANFLLSAAITSWGARVSPVFLMGATMVSFIIRVGLIFVALLGLKHVSFVERAPLGISLIVLYLVVLMWETRYIAGALAFPGLKPKQAKY